MINFGSNGISGNVLQYLTRHMSSDLRECESNVAMFLYKNYIIFCAHLPLFSWSSCTFISIGLIAVGLNSGCHFISSYYTSTTNRICRDQNLASTPSKNLTTRLTLRKSNCKLTVRYICIISRLTSYVRDRTVFLIIGFNSHIQCTVLFSRGNRVFCT